MPSFSFKGVDLHFTDLGKGPAVLLIHGFLESTSMWGGIAPALAKKSRVICIDLPGHGLSKCIGYVHTMDEMAEAAFQLIKHLKIRKAALVGHSMGGYVALAFAEHFPDSVRSLVLFQSTAKDDSEWKKLDREKAIELVKQNHKSFVRKSIPLLFRPSNRPRLKSEIDALKDEALKTPMQGIIAALSGMRDRPNRQILLKFPPFPIHIIAGEKDPRVPMEESKELAQISEYVSLHVIEGVGHMSHIEAPKEALANIQMSLN
jgi:pimeloyl-ACP methyl ester carboxylesterase